MKRYPECGPEYDNTMMFSLDDGSELVFGLGFAESSGAYQLYLKGRFSSTGRRATSHLRLSAAGIGLKLS